MPEPRPLPNEPDFIWDQRLNNGAGAYRSKVTGRILPNARVRSVLDAYVDNSGDVSNRLGTLLRERTISLKDWQLQMRAHIKETHINAAVSAKGGYAQMTQSDWGRVGQIIRKQYQYLDRFAEQIADGKQALDGRFMVRSNMYTEAGVATHEVIRKREMINAGYDEERNMLDPGAEHCGDCLAEAARGWVTIDTLSPIGSRQCLTRDRCTVIYRSTVTGDEVL